MFLEVCEGSLYCHRHKTSYGNGSNDDKDIRMVDNNKQSYSVVIRMTLCSS